MRHYTVKMKWYLIKLLIRLILFALIVHLYFWHKLLIKRFMTLDLKYGITVIHIAWAFFMTIMLLHLFPTKYRSMALLKMQDETFVPVEDYSHYELLKFVQLQNQKAWIVLAVWLIFNSFWGLLYLFHFIAEEELLLISAFYFISDYICILLFCPFQSFIMKNRCCINCRIYDWGHFMMFTPMLFIRNFFSWSLFFMSAIVLIRWEIVYAMHPERFWYGSNKRLQCASCKDRTCMLKRKLAGGKTPDETNLVEHP